MNKQNQEFLTGISDFYMYRSKPPVWMSAEQKDRWKEGWSYASTQQISKPKVYKRK